MMKKKTNKNSYTITKYEVSKRGGGEVDTNFNVQQEWMRRMEEGNNISTCVSGEGKLDKCLWEGKGEGDERRERGEEGVKREWEVNACW